MSSSHTRPRETGENQYQRILTAMVATFDLLFCEQDGGYQDPLRPLDPPSDNVYMGSRWF